MDRTQYKKISTFAEEVNLTPARLRQLIKHGILVSENIDGVQFISSEEQERFMSLDRKPGRKPKLSVGNNITEVYGVPSNAN